MSQTDPDLVTIVYLVHPGQGYQPLLLPRMGITLKPGAPHQVARSIAGKLLKRFPGTVAVVTNKLPPEREDAKEEAQPDLVDQVEDPAPAAPEGQE